MADPTQHAAWGDALYEALRERTTLPPLTEQDPSITIDDAYAVSQHILSRRLADGEQLVGKKIGVTSDAVQQMLGVHQPDFGYLTDTMHKVGEIKVSTEMIQPRAEGEIAFTLAKDLKGPGVTPADVLDAIATAHPCFEIVDSRIIDWKIKIQDTIADNASSGQFVIGAGVNPRGIDLAAVELVVTKNGSELSRGFGSAVQGSPLHSVAWLANTFGARGVGLKAGDIILSGSLVPLEPVVAGDRMTADLGPLGTLDVLFT